MQLLFSKYQGAGNDFIMLDNFDGKYDNLSVADIPVLCDRRFGIGADGLIRINHSASADFEVDYFNADGTKSFCGNGARCSMAFAEKLGLIRSSAVFAAIDGLHEAFIQGNRIHLAMNNPSPITSVENDFTLYTGSPHYIRFYTEESPDVLETGKSIRYSDAYREEGINVNFVQVTGKNELHVSTYERGVEAETLSCGTGVTAAAIAYAAVEKLIGKHRVEIRTKGGALAVEFTVDAEQNFSDVWLIGPGTYVFDGGLSV